MLRRLMHMSAVLALMCPNPRQRFTQEIQAIHRNETKYADSSVYTQSQAVEASRSSRKKTIITVSAIIALIAVLGGLLFFAAKSLNDKSSDKESSTSANESAVSEETTTSSTAQTTAATTETTTEATTTTKDPHEFVGIINTKSDDLSVRAAPSYDAEILGTIPKDAEVKAYTLDDDKDWCRIEYAEKGLSGYSCSHYIINKDNPDESVPHDWVEATYTSPKKCRICGATEGEILKPDYPYDRVIHSQMDGEITGTYYDEKVLDIDSDGEMEFIVCYKNNTNPSATYSSFIYDVYDNGKLVYYGRDGMVDGGPSYCGIIKDNNTGEVFLGLVTEYFQGGGVDRLLPSQQYDFEIQVVYNYSVAAPGTAEHDEQRANGRNKVKERFSPIWGDSLITWWN
ncbi:MAG: SH3 domain-containing protein [Ruminococcus flavefaciens]|nr:SH3 domain-containing protein [Ruminococcus flavefaciens]